MSEYLRAGLNAQVVPARQHMENLAYGDNRILPTQAEMLGLGGDFVQPANRFGQVEPLVQDERGHQGDNIAALYSGGKLPSHITASNESGFAPDSGTWVDKNIEGQKTYTPSIEQVSGNDGKRYAEELRDYFPRAEGVDGHVLEMPAPIDPLYESHGWGK